MDRMKAPFEVPSRIARKQIKASTTYLTRLFIPPPLMDPIRRVKFDMFPFLRVCDDGHVERLLGTTVVLPSLDPATGVSSKDVVINPSTGLSARLYLPPTNPSSQQKLLPLLVYYHGGAFCIESAASPTYHHYLNSIASEASIAIVSVEYRRAPEHLLPIAYDDSLEALIWAVKGHAEPWLRDHVDPARVFLAGDSAGANICHNIAMRSGGGGVRIEGVVLVHPYFWGSTETTEALSEEERAKREGVWRFVCPTSKGVDDPRVNPLAEGALSLAGLGSERVLVCEAEKDFLRGRGRTYYEGLKRSGWKGTAEFVETEGEGHVFHLFNPGCESAKVLMKRLVSFFNNDK
ncbi:putative carboxylesterase 2 [Acorus calamus]|uniref:Carboxylesterase 2 n=1 Tax=Acorus calamus TaxID=4465 RepID=A0AAV9D4T7_ACOCL|nr:putative carboxylesterase 2 [Acorus calamus]